MTAVTISRQVGSLGSQIAFILAETLGYRLVWRDLINEAARKAGAPEAALAAIDDLGILGICPSPQACRAYRREVEALLHELAEEGGVVVMGRASQVILRHRPDVLHVRVIAPAELRARRIAERTGVSEECAMAQVETSDRNRRQYLRRYYKTSLDDPINYHLTVNTAFVDVRQATNVIVRAVESVLLENLN